MSESLKPRVDALECRVAAVEKRLDKLELSVSVIKKVAILDADDGLLNDLSTIARQLRGRSDVPQINELSSAADVLKYVVARYAESIEPNEPAG